MAKTKVLSEDNLGDLFSLMLVAVNKSFFPLLSFYFYIFFLHICTLYKCWCFASTLGLVYGIPQWELCYNAAVGAVASGGAYSTLGSSIHLLSQLVV